MVWGQLSTQALLILERIIMSIQTASRPYQLPTPYNTIARRLEDYQGGEEFPTFTAITASTMGRSVQMDTFFQQLTGRIIATKNPSAQLNLLNAVATYLGNKKALATMETRSRNTSRNPLQSDYGNQTLGNVLRDFGEIPIGSYSGDFSRRIDSVIASFKKPADETGFGPASVNLGIQATIFGQWANDAILSFNKYRSSPLGFNPILNPYSFYTTGFDVEFSSWLINDGSNIEVEVGENVFFMTSVVGQNYALWHKDNVIIPGLPVIDGLESLALTEVQLSDSGVYRCDFNNQESGSSVTGSNFNLVVS